MDQLRSGANSISTFDWQHPSIDIVSLACISMILGHGDGQRPLCFADASLVLDLSVPRSIRPALRCRFSYWQLTNYSYKLLRRRWSEVSRKALRFNLSGTISLYRIIIKETSIFPSPENILYYNLSCVIRMREKERAFLLSDLLLFLEDRKDYSKLFRCQRCEAGNYENCPIIGHIGLWHMERGAEGWFPITKSLRLCTQ